MSEQGNSGGMMIMLLIGGVCCCSLFMSGGLGGFYMLNDDFKATIDDLLGMGDKAIVQDFVDKGCRWNHTKLNATTKQWGCHTPPFTYRTNINKDSPNRNRAAVPMPGASGQYLYDAMCVSSQECKDIIEKTRKVAPT